ncbi:hypothetical protein [Phaffia rhodozyma]|uniref:Uncharacterized protein n=1 Tax=Phaffia rhodozyma TaxID=264483 RepID=A0A0F7SKG6_PHARH|nr:hypothetical protein [Phaffia rhodozyma]
MPLLNPLSTAGLVSRLSLSSVSLNRSIALTSARFTTPSPKLHAVHGHSAAHSVPPEGDINHGRSGYGFQSHDRHEHFTYPGEEQEPFEQEYLGFSNPLYLKTAAVFLLAYLGITYMPARTEREFKPNDPSWGAHDSTAKTGPDDKRPYLVRLVQYWSPSSEQIIKERFESMETERQLAERMRISLQKYPTVSSGGMILQPETFEEFNELNNLPGTVPDNSNIKIRTQQDVYNELGIDPSKDIKYDY